MRTGRLGRPRLPSVLRAVAAVTVLAPAGCGTQTPRLAAAPAPPAVSYRALLIDGAKVGHVRTARTAADGQVTTDETIREDTLRGRTLIRRRARRRSVETEDGRALSVQARTQLTGQLAREYAWKRVDDERAVLQARRGDRRQQNTVPADDGMLLPEGERLLRVRMGFEEGTAYAYRAFEPVPDRAPEVEVEVGPSGPVETPLGLLDLTALRLRRTGPGVMHADETAYVDRAGFILKTETRMGGQVLVTAACDEAYALGEDRPPDPARHFSLDVGHRLPGVFRAPAATFVLRPRPGAELDPLERAVQEVRREPDGRVTVVVRRRPLPRGVARPYEGADSELRAALAPADYLNARDPAVVALARRAAGNGKDAAQAAVLVERFLRTHMTSAVVPHASAAEVATELRGDCTEYAVLATSMLRALGVPARVVGGFAYVERGPAGPHRLVPHAWTEVFLGDGWYWIDPAQRHGAHAGRIGVSTGDGGPAWHAATLEAAAGFTVEDARVGEPAAPAADDTAPGIPGRPSAAPRGPAPREAASFDPAAPRQGAAR